MSGSEVAGLVRYDDASLDGLRSLSAMAESEDYAPAGRASGGEKLAEREMTARWNPLVRFIVYMA